jgi:molybdopterin-guanine dinucleotide biosynthesis protein A
VDLDLTAGGFCGVVLAGGTAARMDGIDKGSVELHGRTLLELAVDAFVDADEVVVVAPGSVPTSRPVTFTSEDPPRGGPVAGLLTGVDALLRRPRLVGVLAVDMPRVTPATMRRLRAAAEGHDGAFLVDADGRRQLAGVLDAGALAGVRPDLEGQHGMALHRLLAPLRLAEVPADGDEGIDIDTWADLRDLAGGQGG